MQGRIKNNFVFGSALIAGSAAVIAFKTRIAAVLLGGAWDEGRAGWLEDMRAHVRVAGYVEIAGWLLVGLGLFFLIVGAVKLQRQATLN